MLTLFNILFMAKERLYTKVVYGSVFHRVIMFSSEGLLTSNIIIIVFIATTRKQFNDNVFPRKVQMLSFPWMILWMILTDTSKL